MKVAYYTVANIYNLAYMESMKSGNAVQAVADATKAVEGFINLVKANVDNIAEDNAF